MKKKKLLSFQSRYLGLFHLIFFLSYRHVLFLCADCIIGHNWDWGFPALDFHFRRLYEISTSTWFSYNFGSGLFLNISQLIPNTILSALAYILSPKYIILLLLYVVHLCALIFFKRLLDTFVKKSNVNWIASFLYAFSPFLFNEVIGGSWYMWISFAAAPLFFNSLYQFVLWGKAKQLGFFLLSSFFVIPSLQNTVLIETIFFLLLIYEIFVSKRKVKIIFHYVMAHILLFCVNLYFILPFLTSLFSLLTYTGKSEFTGNFQSFTGLTQHILGILTLSGYLDRNMYQFVFPSFPLRTWYVAVLGVWIWFVSLVQQKRIKEPRFAVFLWIFVVSILLVKGGLPPFSKVTLFLFRHVPLFSLYRSPQHMMLAPAFLIPILLAYPLKLSKKNIQKMMAGIIVVWIGGWWLTGDIGQQTLARQGKDHVDFYQLSPELKQAYSLNEQQTGLERTIFVPSVISPEYQKTSYQNEAQGGQVEYTLLRSPTFSAEVSPFAKTIDNYFCSLIDASPEQLGKYISLLNVRYIVFRDDIRPKFTECATKSAWNFSVAKQKIVNLQQKLVIEPHSNGTTFVLKNEFVLPKIFVAEHVQGSAESVDNLLEKVADVNYKVGTVFLLNDQNESKNQFEQESTSSARLEFTRSHPTFYSIGIKDASNDFLLTFLEAYDSQWIISQSNNGMLQFFFPQSIVSNEDHLIANGYANAWIIHPKQLCEQYISCSQNADGSYNFELAVQFKPQKLLYLGSLFSGITIVGVFISMIVIAKKQTK